MKLVPLKRINLKRLRDFFRCITPEEASEWIDGLAAEKKNLPKFKQLLDAIAEEQEEQPGAPVEYAAIVTGLRKGPGLRIEKVDVIALCNALASLIPEYVTALPTSVEVNQRPDKILAAVAAATRGHSDESSL